MENNTLPQTVSFEVEHFKRITDEAPAMLETNETSKAKAIQFVSGLFKSIAENGMSDAIDEQLKAFIAKGKVTIDTMNERRKPFTQIVDAVKKRFTTQESELKTVVDTAQKHRDAYATKKMLERQEMERQAALKAQREKEIIGVRQQAEVRLGAYYSGVIAASKKEFTAKFNTFTLETISADAIEHTDIFMPEGVEVMAAKIMIPSTILTKDEIDTIMGDVHFGIYQDYSDRHAGEMMALKRELLDKLPSKQRELEELARAGEAEKARILEEQHRREAAEAVRIAAEAEAERRKAEEEAAVRASAQTTAAIADNAVSMYEDKPDVKEGYRIVVKTTAAYLMIAQFWFEKEGRSISVEKLEKVTFDRMRKFCEAYAYKNEEFIKSDLIKYEPVYRAK